MVTDIDIARIRPGWDDYFMELCYVVAKRSTCLRRQVGAVVVREKRILTTGYNGAPAGVESSLEIGSCLRETMGIPSGQRFEICRGSHAEENAIVQGARFGIPVTGSMLYCTTQPCLQCAKMIINAGIVEVIFQHAYPHEMTEDFMRQAGVKLRKYEGPVNGPQPSMEQVTGDEHVRRLYTYDNLPEDPNEQIGIEAAGLPQGLPTHPVGGATRPQPAYLSNKPVG